MIRVRCARENNLRGIDVDIPLNKITVVTGVSGSGKSSLVFDTIYAEGQRRYVETFSPYARQFLDRMGPPDCDSVTGVLPAVAIRQCGGVKTSRSTVGTMTEINDRVKLLFAKAADLFCPECGRMIRPDNPDSIAAGLVRRRSGERMAVAFEVVYPESFGRDAAADALLRRGYTRVEDAASGVLRVVQDRIRISDGNRLRMAEAFEAALESGKGRAMAIFPDIPEGADGGVERFSAELACPDCGRVFQPPSPNLFSFNSPLGACPDCRGFGRVITVSERLVIPDGTKSISAGCVKPFQTKSFIECQRDLMRCAKAAGIPVDVPWNKLTNEQRRWVWEGEGGFDSGLWWGIRAFFDWLESRSYKMHVRVMLSHYREYAVCGKCGGSRLVEDALCWKLVSGTSRVSVHDLMLMPVSEALSFLKCFSENHSSEDVSAILEETIPRLEFLCEAGLSYLTLDRQSRTLSGGELQRINLTAALGTSLVNTLFVLDEPSIGLHPSDIGRLAGIMRRLRDAGNTILVVEHDPQLIETADHVIEMGPGPGASGGKIVFMGSVQELCRSGAALTGKYLGRPLIPGKGRRTPSRGAIRVKGAREHNLRGIDVDFPLNRLTAVTGVSGSGKSTLVCDVLYPALKRARGEKTESCGECGGVDGYEFVSDVIMVDQSPVGKTARSAPVLYIGAFDRIRKVFAGLAESVARGYGQGDFSFNSGAGRCPVCEGSGSELVEMQFLSDVYLTCEECGGRRYRKEILEIKYPCRTREVSIADVLDMTADEAMYEFSAERSVTDALRPLSDAGLGYIRLGQPLPTLSGGEIQRLKIAAFLAEGGRSASNHSKGALFILDEPTTGLHFSDIEKLIGLLERLVDDGGTVIAIEHNLQFIAAADHVIEMGPGGGDAGGAVVASGSPSEISEMKDIPTGAMLSAAANRDNPSEGIPEAEDSAGKPPSEISVRGASEHNLHNIDVNIPLGSFSVITGVSGSGKSTLAFDILFAMGQRRYLECLNAYARQFIQPQARPDVFSLSALPPTVAIEQRTSRGGWRSTVATVSEAHSGLRLLFSTLGRQFCPQCGAEVEKHSAEEIAGLLSVRHKGGRIGLLARLVSGRKGSYKELAAQMHKQGIEKLRLDGEWVSTSPWKPADRYREHRIDMPVASVEISAGCFNDLLECVRRALEMGNGSMRVVPDKGGEEYALTASRMCPECGLSFEDPDPRLFSFNSHRGWCVACRGYGIAIKAADAARRDTLRGERGQVLDFSEAEDDRAVDAESGICSVCNGTRLSRIARSYKFHGVGIDELCSKTVSEALEFLNGLKLNSREISVAGRVIKDVVSRLGFLKRVGLGYLSLDRAAPTLSGGEAQRIRLASQLGSNLCGACYILDEPTIGLHEKDTVKLLNTLCELRDKGNTVITVEHDEQTMRRADYIVDLGPGAGVHGGNLVASGTLDDVMRCPESITAKCLKSPMKHPVRGKWRECASAARLRVVGACLHNLKNITAEFPLGRFTVVTGVSGSGKSTLVRDILFASLAPLTGGGRPVPRGCAAIEGWETLKRAVEVDQTPIGRTPRSCPATYVGFWSAVREIFAMSPESRMRGFDASRFSFNTGTGRCPVCEGQGVIRSEMAFLPDVISVCPSCGGARFNQETLSVRYSGKNIAEVLAMSVDEAILFFAEHRRVRHSLELLSAVGLGYLTLGQQSNTLSGGEAQRIKLVTELARCVPRPGEKQPSTLYILDEPTVGLHMADVKKLIDALHRLVDAGHTVVAIEHNADVVGEADCLMELGPEGGPGGGRIVSVSFRGDDRSSRRTQRRARGQNKT